jgi:ribosomal protein S8
MKISKDDLTDLKYAIVEELVAQGYIKNCTNTDDNEEVDVENLIQEVMEDTLKIEFDYKTFV